MLCQCGHFTRWHNAAGACRFTVGPVPCACTIPTAAAAPDLLDTAAVPDAALDQTTFATPVPLKSGQIQLF